MLFYFDSVGLIESTRVLTAANIGFRRVRPRRFPLAGRGWQIALTFWLIAASGVWCPAQVNVLTANGSNDRTNTNLMETTLNPATVTPATFGRIGWLPVDGQVYAQVLYASAVAFSPSEVHDVAIVCTMHNSVYAFDAAPTSGGRLLWQVNLGPSVPSTVDINPEIGILSTGVIDLEHELLYVVAETLQSNGPVFTLHALDLTSGDERQNGPAVITATATAPAQTDGPIISLDPHQLLQRPGLLLANGSVYIAFGSHADQHPWNGWIVSYDASNLANQTGVFTTTSAGEGGAIWQSGRGLAADELGNIYAVAGNGDYDGVQNFSESFLKLPGSLGSPTDWFTPANWHELSECDVDLSAGPALISGTHTLIGADKAGDLYVIDGNLMGHVSGGHKYSAGTGYIYNFAVWSRPSGAIVYVQPKGGPVESYTVSQDQSLLAPLSYRTVETSSSRLGLTLSANGPDDASGILWLMTAGRDGSGTLHAFAASNLSTELWNSDMKRGQLDALGAHAKFVSPTVVNGRVYAPTFSNAVMVYGLLSDAYHQPPPANNPCVRPGDSTGSGMDASRVSNDDRGCVLTSGTHGHLE
jgi:hypothetical protein